MGKQCGAKSKQTGQPCKLAPIKGRTRCKFHGGKTLSGVAHVDFKKGRYSKVLPMGLVERFEAAKDDPEHLSHSPEIRLIDSRLESLLKKLDATNPQVALEAIQRAWSVYEGSFISTIAAHRPSPTECLKAVEKAIKESPGDGVGIWSEVMETVEQRSKILERETKRLASDVHMLDAGQLLGIIEIVIDIMRTSVNRYADKPTAQRILTLFTDDLRKVVSDHATGPSGANQPIKHLN